MKDETSENLCPGYDPLYIAQECRCGQAEWDYAQGRIALAAYMVECFLLVYECARLGTGLASWSMEVADESALVLTRHWRQFIEAISDIKQLLEWIAGGIGKVTKECLNQGIENAL